MVARISGGPHSDARSDVSGITIKRRHRSLSRRRSVHARCDETILDGDGQTRTTGTVRLSLETRFRATRVAPRRPRYGSAAARHRALHENRAPVSANRLRAASTPTPDRVESPSATPLRASTRAAPPIAARRRVHGDCAKSCKRGERRGRGRHVGCDRRVGEQREQRINVRNGDLAQGRHVATQRWHSLAPSFEHRLSDLNGRQRLSVALRVALSSSSPRLQANRYFRTNARPSLTAGGKTVVCSWSL